MCIICRSRHPQKSLIRLKQNGKEVIAFNGMGRSFYLCRNCVNDKKKLKGLAKRFKQDLEQLARLLGTLA
ncbi:hypothetical protein YH65_02135 [Sulfurovum lithotrophicum]|uniref:YlxR domain-containing protein n=1 Tax=Sulfurovum lithotrophicum TaxID=206403 RepID=A0A7U4LZX3_9BACT|nr:DUF448 domain-containing protein [Sulfurovum lithotrophicum]AKF24325.1 hypothetical protein YH65_02135 [Sulfurovum lithotrophicum]